MKEITVLKKRKEILKAFVEGIAYTQAFDLDEWADQYRYLPQETSSEFGLWSTARFPFLRRIMKCLSPSNVAQMIVVMKGAQLGFTETAINWLLYSAHCHPGPCLYVQKTDDAAMDFSSQKLRPSILACKAVSHILGEHRFKRYANSWDNKAYPGGFIALGGAGSSAFLRSKSIRDAIIDEEDTFELNVDDEGSPVRLIAKRQVNFPDRKMIRISTPVLEELSTIAPAFEAGSQEHYFVPCPYCNPKADQNKFMFWLKWDQIKWEGVKNSRPIEYWLECPNCAARIEETKNKSWMLANGNWYSEKGPEPDKLVPRYVVDKDVLNPSFHISSLYSPIGFFSWGDAIVEWLEYQATNDIGLLQVFINQTLAETFSLEGHEISYGYLHARREIYDLNPQIEVPADVLVLTAGVDIQDDRIELEVLGHGLLEETWSIDYMIIPGDTSQTGDAYGLMPDKTPSVWRLLDEYLMKKWKTVDNREMVIENTLIDCGYKTNEVHTFCRLREGRRVFPVRGEPGWGKGFWEMAKRRHPTFRTIHFVAHTDEVKNKIYAQLQIDQIGPGFCHFPKKDCYSKKYFRGLTSETKKVKTVNGRKKLYWTLTHGVRNEPLDCRVYAYVALLSYPVNMEHRAKNKIDVKNIAAIQNQKNRKKGSAGL